MVQWLIILMWAVLPRGQWALRFLQAFRGLHWVLFFPWECWLVPCGAAADLSQPGAAPGGPAETLMKEPWLKRVVMKTNVSEGVKSKPGPGIPTAPLSFWRGGSSGQRKYFPLVVYFSWHWKNFSFPPGCSNSHLLTAFHAGLQLTLGRYLPCSLYIQSIHKEVFMFWPVNHFKIL